jgi:hypothetical protein
MTHRVEITYEVTSDNSSYPSIEREYYEFNILDIDKMFDEYGNLCLSHIGKYNKIKEINGIWLNYNTVKGTLIKNYNTNFPNINATHNTRLDNTHNIHNTRLDNMSCSEYIWTSFNRNQKLY